MRSPCQSAVYALFTKPLNRAAIRYHSQFLSAAPTSPERPIGGGGGGGSRFDLFNSSSQARRLINYNKWSVGSVRHSEGSFMYLPMQLLALGVPGEKLRYEPRQISISPKRFADSRVSRKLNRRRRRCRFSVVFCPREHPPWIAPQRASREALCVDDSI